MDYQIGIIGAGFGGIIAALELKKAGFESIVIFERASEVGGVWRENVYPGCACDVPSHLYSIETEPNPRWSTTYASQPEILEYVKGVVSRRELRRHILHGVSVVELKFLEDQACWQVRCQNGRTWQVRAIILATGPQSRPYKPAFPGAESFRGRIVHSSSWDLSVDLAGKKVAVIGTGASAIQIVPNVAGRVASLSVFQRTPAWILPRGNRRITAFERLLFEKMPITQRWARAWFYCLLELVGLGFLGNALIHRALTMVALHKLKKEVADPDIRYKMTPQYKIGCKRVLVADDFYPAFNLPNVHLFTEAIEKLLPQGIRTQDGRVHDVDVIIYATGFTVADTDNYLQVSGAGGRVLKDEWDRNAPEAYLGVNVAGFPNMVLLLGPNSGLGHSSALHVMESQMRYVIQYLKELEMLAGNISMDVRPDVQQRYNIELQRKLSGTVWASGCRSWYLNRKGWNSTLYPGLTRAYRDVTASFRREDYALVTSEGRDGLILQASRKHSQI